MSGTGPGFRVLSSRSLLRARDAEAELLLREDTRQALGLAER